ncbi:MAG: tRNA lysidine(34) synthetase TilS [Bacteroidales bacterium]|nr:tRNA lysidine(34) synthetase TilS [Bacteroidales bacterium]
MLQRFNQYIATHHLADRSQQILLAISGGADSVSMLDLFAKAGFDIAISHVNFHLRGDDSNRDEAFVRSLAHSYNVPIFVKDFDTQSYAAEKHISIEMAARELRYAEFEKIMDHHGFASTAVAHHIDDAIETFLLNLLRGTGISGLTGMHSRNGRIIRPMLCFSRKDIEKYVQDNGLQYVTDVTNFETEFSRNKIRNCVAPYFEQINPSYRNSFAETFTYLQQVKEIYYREIEDQKRRITRTIGGETLVSIPELMQYHQKEALMFEILRQYGFNKTQVSQILNAAEAESGKTFMSDNYRLVKDRNMFVISNFKEEDNGQEILLGRDALAKGEFRGDGCVLRFDIIPKTDFSPERDSSTAYFDFDSIEFPLVLRHWQSGDTIVPFGRRQPKKLSDIFIDHKLTILEKERVRILCSGGKIIWAVGIRAADTYKVTPKTLHILRIISEL